MKKDLQHYLCLRYPMEIVEAEEGGYVGQFPDLPGCITQGETIEEVVKNLEDAKRSWIEVRLEDGLDVPPPHEAVEEYSGRFLMRVPKSLHRELATHARQEGTSLNQYVLHLLSLALGREEKAGKESGWALKDILSRLALSRAHRLENTFPSSLSATGTFAATSSWTDVQPRGNVLFRDLLLEGQEVSFEEEQGSSERIRVGVVWFNDRDRVESQQQR